MGQEPAGRSLLLADAGPDGPSGAVDLLAYYGLSKLAAVLKKGLPPTPYLRGVPGPTTLYKGPGLSLEELAARPPAGKAAPLRADELSRVRLRPGSHALPEAAKGERIEASTLYGPPPAAPQGEAPPRAKKEKRKDREREKDRKDKKERKAKRQKTEAEAT